jgi:RHS repeat-associated protein
MNMSFLYDSADRLTQQTYQGETLTYDYDAAWRQISVCGTVCYVSGATYTALDQPEQWSYGNGVLQDWIYSSPTQHLQRLKLGSGTPASIFDRSYSYDNNSNVTAIADNKAVQPAQSYTCDHRDRLTTWTLGATTQTYTYNTLGNIISKPGNGVYSYPASGSSSVRPHTPSAVNGAAYTYDNNGNLTAGGGRTYTWTAENLPASIAHVSGTQSYAYDADGERIAKTVGGTTTIYFAGVQEQIVGTSWKRYYQFNGQVVAVRDSAGTLTYLQGDHLGSAGVSMTSAGAVAQTQEYDPWGKVRTGGITATDINYTGQRLDATGLLYYHARMYDPLLGRFVSADSVVPGSASDESDDMDCCEDMHDAIAQGVAIVYIPKFREYGIRILDGGTSFKVIIFCPWCGAQLPASLRDLWLSEVERLGFEPDSVSLPSRFKTDTW